MFKTFEEALKFQDEYEERVFAAADAIRARIGDVKPVFGITLGSGLNDLISEIDVKETIPYTDIPNFRKPIVKSHEGNLIYGEIEGIPVVCLQGRTHYYEVADWPMNTGMLQVVLPIHALAELGTEIYFPTNAAGGINLYYKVGELMAIKSHSSQLPNPLLGRPHSFKRIDGKDPSYFVALNDAYDDGLRAMLIEAGSKYGTVHSGFLKAMTGRTYESIAEVIESRIGGADAAGMSVAPEVVVARSRGMKVVGFSIITNETDEEGKNPADHDEVEKVLKDPATRLKVASTVKEFFRMYKERIYQR
jgi:purine-nucleoside phosphorylase